MIQVNNLSFCYQEGIDVLQGIDLDLDRRSTAIIGQNGSGKTTLVKLLKGLLTPSKGEIIILGENTKQTTAAALAKRIGLVFQNPNDQIFKRNVWDEVLFGPQNIRMPESEAKKNASIALEMVGLQDKLKENPHDLSLSDKKLLCIASVLAMNPEIVIFDEPTIAQDYEGREKIKQIIHSLKEQQKLVMTIIHDMDFVAENFERTIVMSRGKILLDGDTREVFSQPDLLAEAHVKPPYITQLGSKLGWKQTLLTVEEFVEAYQRA